MPRPGVFTSNVNFMSICRQCFFGACRVSFLRARGCAWANLMMAGFTTMHRGRDIMGIARWIKTTYEMINGVYEVTISPTTSNNRKRLPQGRSSEEKNAKDAKRILARLLNNNFAVGTDCCLTLTYTDPYLCRLKESDDGESPSDLRLYLAAKRDMEKYMKRCRRACKTARIDLRYIYVISDLDGKSAKSVRVHIHLIVNKEAVEICKQQWTAGYVTSTTLYSAAHGDLSRLAQYLIDQVRDLPRQKRYHPSRGLKVPEKSVTQHTHYPSLDLPLGCVLTYRSQSCNGTYMIRYYRPPPQLTV